MILVFLWRICEEYFRKRIILSKIHFFEGKKRIAKKVTIAYNMKGCLRVHAFMFLISKSLAKYTYGPIAT